MPKVAMPKLGVEVILRLALRLVAGLLLALYAIVDRVAAPHRPRRPVGRHGNAPTVPPGASSR